MSVLFVRFCYVSAVCHCLSRVLPLGRAFAEAGNVSVRVPVVSSPPEPSQNSSLCLGGSPAVASPSREGDAGDGGWGAGLPSAAAELRYQHHVWGKHGGMFSGRERSRLWFYFGSQRRAKTPGAPELHAPASLSSDSEHNALPSCNAQDFSPIFSRPSLCPMCVRGQNQNLPSFTRRCFTSPGFSLCFVQRCCFFFVF